MRYLSILILLITTFSSSAQTKSSIFTSAENGTNGQIVTPALVLGSTSISISNVSVGVTGGFFVTSNSNGGRSFRQDNLKSRQFIRYSFDRYNRVSLSFDFVLGDFRGNTWGYYDFAALEGGGEYVVLAFKDFPGKDFAFRVHTQAGVGPDIQVKSNRLYRIKLLWDQTERNSVLKVFDEFGVLLGTSTLILQNWPCQAAIIGRYDAHAASSKATNLFDNISVDISGNEFYETLATKPITTPTIQITSPPPTTVVISPYKKYTTNVVFSVITNISYTTNVYYQIKEDTFWATNYVTNNSPQSMEIITPKPITSPTTGNAGVENILKTTGSYNDFKEVYNKATNGQTILITSSAVWTASMNIAKKVYIRGIDKENTVITFNLPAKESSGFTVTADGVEISDLQIRGPKRLNKGRGIEVKANGCKLHDLIIDQLYWGMYIQHGFNLVYNVNFRDCQKFIRFHGIGAGDYNWDTYYPIAFNSLKYNVVEDCLFENTEEMPNVGVLNAISSQQGASWILRNSQFRLTKYPYGPVLDAHGNINPGLRGVVSVQIINNDFEVTSPAEVYKFFDWRGGSGIFASNRIKAASGTMVTLREEDYPNTPLTPPYTDPHTDIYIWSNSIPAGVEAIRVDANDLPIIRKGIEYFDSAPTNFLSIPYPHPLRTTINSKI